MLCEYSDIFGKPGEGSHAYRIFNLAIVDLFGTIFVAFLLSKYYPKYNFVTYLALLLLLGIIMHKIFCVETRLNKSIFG